MLYATPITEAERPADAPVRFDPAIGPDPSVVRIRSDHIRPSEVIPVFIAVGKDRSSVQGWRSALHFALSAARNGGADNFALSELSGIPIRPGRGHPRMTFHPDLNASIPSMGTDRTARALYQLLNGLGRSALIRVRTGVEPEAREMLIEHRATVPRPVERTMGGRPAVSIDATLDAARRGVAMYGSLVEIGVEGLFERRAFRLAGSGSDPRTGALSIRSPIAAALLGCAPGEDVSYEVGTGRRRIDLFGVDNTRVIARLAAELPAP